MICLVNERNTTVLPCRHMCMCHECAQELRKQTSKCPICREHVESLLYIRMVRDPRFSDIPMIVLQGPGHLYSFVTACMSPFQRSPAEEMILKVASRRSLLLSQFRQTQKQSSSGIRLERACSRACKHAKEMCPRQCAQGNVLSRRSKRRRMQPPELITQQ